MRNRILNIQEEADSILRPAIVLLAILTVVTGIVYPLVITGVSQIAFPHSANGSLIERDGVTVGSRLIGQQFMMPGYFWSRPSATGPYPYNAGISSGSNHGPLNPALVEAARQRVAALRAVDPGNTLPVPVDLVTASGSGLDPHISVAAARYQTGRVARARGMTPESVRVLVERHTVRPALGLFGEPTVHVVELNLDLDAAARNAASGPHPE